MILTIALSTWTCRYPDDVPSVAAQSGFCAVEWDLNYIPIPLSPGRRLALRNRCSDLGLRVRFHLPYSTCDVAHSSPFVRQTSLDYLRLNLDLVAEMGTDVAVAHFATAENNDNQTTEALVQLSEHAASVGLILAVENAICGVTSDPTRLAEIARSCGCRVALDTGHAVKLGDPLAFKSFLQIVAPWTVHVHFYGSEDESRSHRPFSSEKDTATAARQLLAHCPAPWWTCEMDDLEACIAQRLAVQRLLGS